jgi:hypothetical protein
MSIAVIYRVSVVIHEDVYQKFGHTKEYERKSREATEGNESAGQNSYAEVEEWAEFHTLANAQACQKRLMDMVYCFASKLGDEAEIPEDLT